MKFLMEMFKEDNGRPSFMRGMCAVAIVNAVIISWITRDLQLTGLFVGAAFCSKVGQKFFEERVSVCLENKPELPPQ